MIAVRLILPELVASLRTGITLDFRTESTNGVERRQDAQESILRRVGRINDDRILGSFVGHQIGVIVARTNPLDAWKIVRSMIRK